ncbi:TPA: glucose uptake protein [Enterococcus faecium]
MIAIGQFVFYIPFFIMLSILFYYIKWTKKKFSVLLASLPAVYFTYQIFSFRHWETTSVLVIHIIELTLAVVFLIIWIYFLYKKSELNPSSFKRKRLKISRDLLYL